MNDLWADTLTIATACALAAVGAAWLPAGLIFIAALLTYLAAGWIKDIRQWRTQRQRYSRTSNK